MKMHKVLQRDNMIYYVHIDKMGNIIYNVARETSATPITGMIDPDIVCQSKGAENLFPERDILLKEYAPSYVKKHLAQFKKNI